MKTKITLYLVLLIAAYLLTACLISITTNINEDGSGEFGIIYKFTQDDLSQMAGMGMNADTICADMQSQEGSMPENYAFKQEKHGDETWCVASESFDDLATVKAGFSAAGLIVNTLEIDSGKLTFDANFDLSGQNTSGMESMPISFSIYYELTVPGKITNNNADSLNGNTAVWALSLSSATSLHLESNLGTSEEVQPTIVTNETSGGNEAGNEVGTSSGNTTGEESAASGGNAGGEESTASGSNTGGDESVTSGGNTGGEESVTSEGSTGGEESTTTSGITGGNTQESTNGSSIQDSLQKYWWAIAIVLLCCCLIVIVVVVVVFIIIRKR
jgi:hypothetical protein